MTAVAEAPASTTGSPQLLEIALEDLHESPKNPRTHYEPVALQQLAANLKAAGQITPVVVRPRPNGNGYELAAGHRRKRAAQLAGLPALMAIVREMDEAQFVEILNIENLQRDDLNALEEAKGFTTLMADVGYDVPQTADRVGRSIKYVYDRLKLLQLIPEAKKLLLDGTITPGHGILLARLSKDDQKRALEADEGSYRSGGLLEREQIDDSYFPPELDLEDEPKKARSVRELAQWIDRNVRFVPAKVDQTDLAFDLPQTAELLETAAKTKLKVVKITREYRVPDQARDESERTIGSQGWKRADGEMEDADRFGEGKPKRSLTCEYSRVGLIVAGPGRGEAFLVCVNKEKCTVHWAQAMKERAARAKEREREAAKNGSGNGSAPAAKAAKVDPNVLPADLRQKWVQEELEARAPGIVKEVKTVIAELTISDEICWNLVTGNLYLHTWNKVGKRLWTTGRTHHAGALAPLVGADLPGRLRSGAHQPLQADDGPGARSELAWLIWVNRDSDGLDKSIEKAVAARWAAQRRAAAKQATPKVQTSATPKKRAGDVARAKKKKPAAAGGRK